MYYRLVKMSGKWYASEFDDLEHEAYSIMEFVDQGEVVVLTDDLEEFAELMEIDIDEIEVI